MKCGNCKRELSRTDGTPRLKRPPDRPKMMEAWCERCSIWFPTAGDEGRAIKEESGA